MLTPIGENIWELNRPQSLSGIQIGHRMTVIRLGSDGLLIHSPVRLDEILAQQLLDLGPVRHVVAPSRMHDLYLKAWFNRFPQAAFYCAPGLEIDHPEFKFNVILSNQTGRIWGGELECLLIEGMPRINEVVFFHSPSRSLIVADLVFNLGPPMPFFSEIFWKINRAYNRVTPSKLFKACIKEKSIMKASLDRVLAWDFDRIIVGHGRNVETDGKAILRDAYSWL